MAQEQSSRLSADVDQNEPDAKHIFVKTRTIQLAVKGHETEILDRLKIDWRTGNPHIRCPYPKHEDQDPSWRWDPNKARAFCTYLEKSHSIFDVVMEIESLDFEQAKIRIAKMLGRNDLIKSIREKNQCQTMDAASLLNPTPENSDVTLPVKYLAHRMGLPVEQVPLPSTPAAGHRLLPYFDPPANGKGKPKLIGHWPCAVFGTVDANGKTHAQRIYLAPDGQGKLDLGVTEQGYRRDPKKSAKVVGDDKISGRCVVWGDLGAPHVYLFEGIETAAPAALAYATEIQAEQVAVAAAISATGIEQFQPSPTTRRVTVGADRDEAPKAAGRASSRRGEQAARNFALCHYQQIEISIALPGKSGESVDWLDVFVNEGLESVRQGLDHAVPFAPTPQETDALEQARTRRSAVENVQDVYPVPEMHSHKLEYRHTRSGQIWLHRLILQDKTPVWTPLTTPFGVPARLRYVDQDDAYGLRVLVEDMEGRPRAVDFGRDELARMGAAEIRARLFAGGLRVEQDGEAIAVQALKIAGPAKEIVVVSRPGWHWLADKADPVFVTPGGEIIGLDDGHLELTANLVLPPLHSRAGSFQGWTAAIESVAGVDNCPHWILGLCSGFAGPLVNLMQIDSCGQNFSGLTSRGKTLAEKLGVSCWTTPAMGRGLLQPARTTTNALEVTAERATGTLLVLDDLAHASGKDVAGMLYGMASNTGKARMNERARRQWITFSLLSYERSLKEKIISDGGAWNPGIAVRFPDIDVTEVNSQVDQATLTKIAGINEHYGHAGPAFVRELIREGLHRQPEALRDRINQAARRLAEKHSDSAHIRAAMPFALQLVGGELAKYFRILPLDLDVKGAVEWAWATFLRSAEGGCLEPAVQAVANLRQWIAERWNVTIKHVEADSRNPMRSSESFKGVNNREALAWYDDQWIYFPRQRLAQAAGGELKEEQVKRILAEKGWLKRRGNHLSLQYIPLIGKVDCYGLARSEFGRTDIEATPLKVVGVHE